MAEGSLTIKETTQPELSGYLVGVSNIWERELPDKSGVVAKRLSAALAITRRETGETRHEKVVAGSLITLGGDTYCVEKVEEGSAGPGAIVVRKMKS